MRPTLRFKNFILQRKSQQKKLLRSYICGKNHHRRSYGEARYVPIYELLNKDPYIVPEKSPLIILDSDYAMCMAKNGKDIKNTRNISRIMNFVSNGEKCKMHKIDWCEGGLKLSEIATKNVVENDLTPRMKYIMVILDN